MANTKFFHVWSHIGKTLKEFGELLSPYITSSSTPSYKVYSALLTQTDDNAPVVTVLENTLGVNVDCWYNNVGSYYFESFGTFIEGKTTVTIGPLKGNTWGEVSQTFGTYPDQIFILTFRVNTDNNMPDSLEAQNNVLEDTFVEIRVYN